MSLLNFIDNLPRKTVRAFRSWCFYTGTATIVTLALISIVSLSKYFTLQSLQEQQNMLQKQQDTLTLTQKESYLLAQKQKKLQQTLHAYSSEPACAQLLTVIAQIVPPDTALTSISFKSPNLLLVTGKCYNIQSIQLFIQALGKNTSTKDISVSSIIRENGMFTYTLQGHITQRCD